MSTSVSQRGFSSVSPNCKAKTPDDYKQAVEDWKDQYYNKATANLWWMVGGFQPESEMPCPFPEWVTLGMKADGLAMMGTMYLYGVGDHPKMTNKDRASATFKKLFTIAPSYVFDPIWFQPDAIKLAYKFRQGGAPTSTEISQAKAKMGRAGLAIPTWGVAVIGVMLLGGFLISRSR